MEAEVRERAAKARHPIIKRALEKQAANYEELAKLPPVFS